MKKTLKYISLLTALLVGFSGCIKEEWKIENKTGEELPYPSEGKALVTFTVAVPGGYASTKATMADTPTIENMRVVVFGSSGFLKESADIETFQSATTNGNATLYTYQAQLSLTDSKNLKVHIIANLGDVKLPWKYDTEVMTKYAYTTNNQDAYWASFTLPSGITLKKVWNDETQSMDYVKNGDFYQVTDDVTDAFCGGSGRPGLPLVRNFAKISIQSTTPQFVLDKGRTLAVINRPDRGSVAPYNHLNGNFLLGYKDSLYVDKSVTPNIGLKYTYPGYSPEGTQYVDTDPDGASVIWGTGTGEGEEIVSSVYMYERPVPAAGEPISYMIVHGIYYPFKEYYFDQGQPKNWKDTERTSPGTFLDKNNGIECYYKVDFKDEEGAYAIFRNFRYHIRITNVAKAGADSPGAAGSTGGTGDISQDQSVAGLTDFSDGYGRIAVSHTGWTFVEGRAEFELKYKFIEDAAEGDSSANNALVEEGGPVTITIGTKTGPINVISSTLDSSITGEGTVIDGGANGKIKVMGASTAKDAEGFRTIKFTINTPDQSDMTTQTIHISGRVNEVSTLSRDITYYLMPRQNMIVECLADEINADYGEDYVERAAGEGINVRVTIPKMLPESMFPLVFSLESDVLSITPNTTKYPDDNLPVASGNSICTGKESSKTFHYVRTLSYSEYLVLDEATHGMQFTCHFKTNKADSAGEIYVDNQYFNKGNDSFYNYTMYNFRNLSFNTDSAGQNANVDFTFYLDQNDTHPSSARIVEVRLDGLVPRAGANLTVVNADQGVYSYSLNNGVSNATLQLKTITTAAGFDNTYAVTLNAYEDAKAIYHEASHGNVAQRITIDPESYTMHVGDKKTLTATVWPASTGTGSLSWSSSNTSVATVDANGKVTAVALGTANITASKNGMSATCVITVAGISLNKTSTTIPMGNTEQLTATVYPSVSYSWTSSNPSVATVDNNGLVTPVANGTTTIKVTTADGGYTASCTVTVKTAHTKSFNTTSSNISTGNNKTVSNSPVSITFSNIYDNGNTYVRPGRNATITVSVGASRTISNVVITFVSGYTYDYTVTTGTKTYDAANNRWTWNGLADDSLVITNGYDRSSRITNISVTYLE